MKPAAEIAAVESAAMRWSRLKPIVTGEDYLDSLRGRDVTVYLFGEKIEEPVDHPIIRPSINALKMTYDLAIPISRRPGRILSARASTAFSTSPDRRTIS
jgi:hypothetical protein